MYQSVSRTIDAIQWTGDNLADVQNFIGAGNVAVVYGNSIILVRTVDARWAEVNHGWWIIREDAAIGVYSAEAFQRSWKEV